MKAALRTYMNTSPSSFVAPASASLAGHPAARAGSFPGAEESEERGPSSLALRRAAAREPAPSYGAQPLAQEATRSHGQPVDAPARAVIEPRLGHDFSHTRVTTDARDSERAKTFGAQPYAPSAQSRLRRPPEFMSAAAEQSAGPSARRLLQRQPVFNDESCDDGQKRKIERNVGIATELVRNAVSALEQPETVAAPLRRFFSIDVNAPGARPTVLISEVKRNLVKIQKKLEGPVATRCAPGAEMRGVRGQTEIDAAAGTEGIAYNRNVFSILGFTTRAQVVNTIIHEYAHLVGVGHGEMGEPVSNENSTKIRGLTDFQAMNNAESYMRFVRAVN